MAVTPAEKAIKQSILDRNAALRDKDVAAVMASDGGFRAAVDLEP